MEELKKFLRKRVEHASKRLTETIDSQGDTPSKTHTFYGGETLGYWKGVKSAYENIIDKIEGERK